MNLSAAGMAQCMRYMLYEFAEQPLRALRTRS